MDGDWTSAFTSIQRPQLPGTLPHIYAIATAAMASANLLSLPPSISPPTALALSQKAPLILANPPTSSLPWPLSLLFSR